MKLIEYADREMLAIRVADLLVSDLRNSLAGQEIVSFAVPGGTTPAPIFDLMSAAELDWDRVHVMLTDERWVDEESAHSNARLIRRHLLTGPAAAAQFIPFYRAGMAAGDGAAEVAGSLDAMMPISVLMLGMGADMHTASLFPQGEGLEAAMAPDAPLLCAVQPKAQDMARVSLPAHALSGAMARHLVIFGEEKRAALERAMTLPPEEAPIGAVIGGGTVHWAA